MKLDFTSTKQLPLFKESSRRAINDEMVRDGLVRLSHIAIGDIVFLPTLRAFAKHLNAGLGSINRYGNFPNVLHTLTGLTIINTSGVVAVANSTKIEPLGNYFSADGLRMPGTLEWNFRGDMSVAQSRKRKPYYLTDDRMREGLIETSQVFPDGEAAVLPSIQALRLAVKPGFATTYNNGMNFHDVLSTITGNSLHCAGYLGLPVGSRFEPASVLMNTDGSRMDHVQTQQNLDLMS